MTLGVVDVLRETQVSVHNMFGLCFDKLLVVVFQCVMQVYTGASSVVPIALPNNLRQLLLA